MTYHPATTYYDRTPTPNSDGAPLFHIPTDLRNEEEARQALEAAWKCEIKPFGRLTPIDFYALRDGRMVGVVELKTRSHSKDQYDTVFLNVRKWLGLCLAETGLGCPGIFVAKFTDAMGYVRAVDIQKSEIRIGGCSQRVKSHSDVEPVICVPITELTWIPQ